MKQVRKFEQDAIVNQIMEGVNEITKAKQKDAEKTADFKAMKKMCDEVNKLQQQQNDIYALMKDKEQKINQSIKAFNIYTGDSMQDLLAYNVHNNEGIRWCYHSWQTRDRVADKLAIALLETNAQDRIKDIISAIAKEVS